MKGDYYTVKEYFFECPNCGSEDVHLYDTRYEDNETGTIKVDAYCLGCSESLWVTGRLLTVYKKNEPQER
jgi:transcriptional regulator NrdR family protein